MLKKLKEIMCRLIDGLRKIVSRLVGACVAVWIWCWSWLPKSG